MADDAAQNKETVLRYFLESHNPPYRLDVIAETCAPEYAEGARRWQQMEREAFPDKQFTVEQVIAEGDLVALRWTIRATHRGPFWTPMGTVAATGKQIELTSMGFYRLVDGRIAEEWGTHDWLRLLQQFGKLPTSLEA